MVVYFLSAGFFRAAGSSLLADFFAFGFSTLSFSFLPLVTAFSSVTCFLHSCKYLFRAGNDQIFMVQNHKRIHIAIFLDRNIAEIVEAFHDICSLFMHGDNCDIFRLGREFFEAFDSCKVEDDRLCFLRLWIFQRDTFKKRISLSRNFFDRMTLRPSILPVC